MSKKAFAGFVDHPDGGASVCKRYGEPSKLGGLRRNDNLWARQLLGGIKRDSEAEVLDALRSALAETNVRVRRGDRGAPLALGESGIVTGTLLHRAATALKVRWRAPGLPPPPSSFPPPPAHPFLLVSSLFHRRPGREGWPRPATGTIRTASGR